MLHQNIVHINTVEWERMEVGAWCIEMKVHVICMCSTITMESVDYFESILDEVHVMVSVFFLSPQLNTIRRMSEWRMSMESAVRE